jgi:tellurite resistance protein TehA-like permease
LEQRILSVIPITAGLIVEWLALWRGGFGLSWRKAVVVDVVMNAVSTGVGIVLIPALGLAWEYFPGLLVHKVFNVGTFNPGTWAATFVMAVLATTAIEAAVVRWGFKVSLDRPRFWILCAANGVSIAIAFASLWIYPPKS